MIIVRIRKWRNLAFSQRSDDNVCVMPQKVIECLNTIKRHSGRIFIKFERSEGSFEILGVFTKFSGTSYYEVH